MKKKSGRPAVHKNSAEGIKEWEIYRGRIAEKLKDDKAWLRFEEIKIEIERNARLKKEAAEVNALWIKTARALLDAKAKR